MLNITLEKIVCVLKGATPRPELRGKDDSTLGIDLRIMAEVPVEFLDSLVLPGGDRMDYQRVFFDEEGMPKNLGIKYLPFDREYEDQIVTVFVGRQKRTFEDRTLIKGITAKFITGHMIQLNLTIQVHVDPDGSGWLNGGLLKKTIQVQIDPQKQMDIEDNE